MACVEGGARLRFGFPGKFWEWRARLVLCGPFVGRAYIDTDPTPSRNDLRIKLKLPLPTPAGAWRAWLAWARGLGYERRGRGIGCQALCYAKSGACRGQQQQKATAYIRGYYIPPRNVVGSDSHVGATLAYIGLHLGGLITLQKVRPTFADVSLRLAYVGFCISLQGWEGDGRGRKFRFINTVSRYRCVTPPHDIPPFPLCPEHNRYCATLNAMAYCAC